MRQIDRFWILFLLVAIVFETMAGHSDKLGRASDVAGCFLVAGVLVWIGATQTAKEGK